MWSGAHSSSHDSGAREPGFNPTPKPWMAFSEAPVSLLSDNRLKYNVILWYQVEINNIIITITLLLNVKMENGKIVEYHLNNTTVKCSNGRVVFK